MREVEVKEAGKMLAQLVEAAEAAEEVVLTRAGKPVAQLVRLPFAASGIQVGVLKGRLPDDLVDSINRPSISSVLAEWEQIDEEWPEIADPPGGSVDLDPK